MRLIDYEDCAGLITMWLSFPHKECLIDILYGAKSPDDMITCLKVDFSVKSQSWTHDYFLPVVHVGTHLSEVYINMKTGSFKNVVCKIKAILFRNQHGDFHFVINKDTKSKADKTK